MPTSDLAAVFHALRSSEMSTDELVVVMVPKKHLAKVYGYIAKLDEPSASTAASAVNGVHSSASDEWTPSRIRTAVQQSPPAMKDILRALASRPNEWVPTHDLAGAIQGNDNATWKTVAGTLGAFGRRVKNRYGLESLPFERRWDHTARCKMNRMSADIAKLILEALDNGEIHD